MWKEEWKDGMIRYTIIVDEVCDADSEQGRVETGIKSFYSFALEDATDGVVCGGLRSFGFHLRTR